MGKNFFLKLLIIIVLIISSGCAQIDYRLSGYRKISFEWSSEVRDVFLDNRRIFENEVYYVNNIIHKIEWIQSNNEYIKRIHFDKSGRYYIGDSRVYRIKNNLRVVDRN